MRQGWRGGDVRIQATEPEPGRTYVVVEVDPGRPDTLDSITFVGDLEGVVDVDVLERWARGAGLRVGAPMAPDAPAKAQDRIRERLGRVRRWLWRR